MAKAKAHQSWTVLPHAPIEQLDDNLWRVEGSLPNMPLKRVMTLVRLRDGNLAIHNPIALEEKAMGELEALGQPSFLVVPNGWHRLDAKIFADRYPQASVITATGARDKVAQVVSVGDDTLPVDPNVSWNDLDGTRGYEGVMTVRSKGGVTLVFCDAIFNMPHLTGVQGLVLKHLTQSSGGPRISRISRLFLIKDKAAFAAHLERLATPDLVRILVGHHETITDQPAETLRRLAASLQ